MTRETRQTHQTTSPADPAVAAASPRRLFPGPSPPPHCFLLRPVFSFRLVRVLRGLLSFPLLPTPQRPRGFSLRCLPLRNTKHLSPSTRVEQGAGAVAVGGGSSRCRPACAWLPVPQSAPWPRFLRPLIKARVRVSRTRLSEFLHIGRRASLWGAGRVRAATGR